jgi:Major tropism determinant N-terminal domain
MATQVQFRRGTTADHSTFTGAVGEITIDTTKDVVVVHDGAKVGGFPMAPANNAVMSNVNITALSIGTSSAIPTSNLDLTGNFSQVYSVVSTNNVNCALSNYFTKTISTTTAFTFTNAPPSSRVYSFILELTAAGSYTITWPASVKWPSAVAPVLSTGVDILAFVTDDGGTTWRGIASMIDSR